MVFNAQIDFIAQTFVTNRYSTLRQEREDQQRLVSLVQGLVSLLRQRRPHLSNPSCGGPVRFCTFDCRQS